MSKPLRLLFSFIVSFTAALPTHAQNTYQAESSTLRDGASVGSAHGVGYAENITRRGTSSVPGSSVTFSAVNVSTARTYAVDFRYSAARSWASSFSIYVNGTDVTQALFPSTASWHTWATHTVPLNLRQGANTIMLRYDADDNGWINLDYLRVKPEAISASYSVGAASTAGWFPQEVSVDKFTGTAQLYLPLHTVQAGGVSVPIGLSYAATGVRVDDRGGKVGVNWALSGGVSISREVRGLPDDIALSVGGESRYGWLVYPSGATPNGKINAVPNAPAAFSATACTAAEATALQELTQMGSLAPEHSSRTLYDSEPDVFYYSLPGHSGKFVFDAQGQARTIPYDHITITPTIPSASAGITSFTIGTADGSQYTFGFNERETITKKVVNVTANPGYFLREYWLYKLPDANRSFDYAYAWQASSIHTVAGEHITFDYLTVAPLDQPAKSSRRLVRGANATASVEEYRTETTTTRKYLTSVRSSNTTKVQINLVQAEETEYYVKSVDVYSTAATNVPLIRTYLLDYQNAEPSPSVGRNWYDGQGNSLSEFIPTRRFLRRLRVTNGCSTQPLYEFAYNQLDEVPDFDPILPKKSIVALPATGANDRDYWGFYTPNSSPTLIPKLYVYPQLLGQAPVLPAAPYRLYEATGPAATGGFSLPGADRRPAACFNFQAALAGTLTSLTLPGGGKVFMEYEAHRFYDPVADQSYPAGGTRIRAIRVQDPITGIEARRAYGYQDNYGRASGVLLHAPRFAFALPANSTPGQTQWADATVRCGEDLADDPFESRAIGYRQVSEQMTGTGQVVTVYHVPGSADESTVAASPAAGISFPWTRSVMGVARQSCPSVAPLQASTDQYPFAPATNYDFRRGLPQNVSYLAEPVNGAAPVLVRREIYAYEYRNLAPPTHAAPVVGLVYEQLLGGSSPAYAYAKYTLLTEYLYAIRRQTETVPSRTLADNQSDTWYNYNAQGWLAAQGKTNSDGKGYRTRYKYLTDYPLSSAPATTANGMLYQALRQRFDPATEHISSTLVETISEVVTGPNEVRFAGATLNTFTPATSTSPVVPTRPHQVRRWQPVGPLGLTSGYDSTRVNLTAGGAELYISPNFRLASTLLETTPRLVPLSTRTEAGRQLASVHLGYGNTLPVLQIANARASEVVFSDFESSSSFGFELVAGAGAASAAARTGQMGLSLAGTASLSASLPVSTASSYRLSFWARPTPGSTNAVIISATISGGSGTPPAQTVSLEAANGSWRLYEMIFDVSGIPQTARTGYTLQLTTNAPTQLDDVLLLPVSAAATSTTYDLAKGKTSETDGRGRTTFYEYNAVGDLARVRDHNGAIVKQVEKIMAGRVPDITPSFVIEGIPHDGLPLTFRANTVCNNNLVYSWNFGDGTPAGAGTAPSHSFSTGGRIQTFPITLSASIPGQSKVYTSVQYVEIRPAPVTVNSCMNGVVSIDNCGTDADDVLENTCSPGTPPQTRNNTYSVSVDGVAGLLYSWNYREASGSGWLFTGQTGPSITVPVTTNPITVGQRAYQCTVSNSSGVVLGVSQVFSIQRYNGWGNATNPCPTIR